MATVPGRELTLFPSEMTFTGIPPPKLQPAFAELKLASQTATAHQGFPCTLRHQPGHHYRAGRQVRKARGPPRPDRCTRRSPPMAPLLPCCRELFKHPERDAGGAGVVQIAEDGTDDRSGRCKAAQPGGFNWVLCGLTDRRSFAASATLGSGTGNLCCVNDSPRNAVKSCAIDVREEYYRKPVSCSAQDRVRIRRSLHRKELSCRTIAVWLTI